MILHELMSYELLRVIWWGLLGVLLIGFALTDGFDMGVGALLPFVARSDVERRIAINTVGPVWEGNQVWFILGGGAIFAAWPPLYAVSFSGFYLAMFVVLAAFIEAYWSSMTFAEPTVKYAVGAALWLLVLSYLLLAGRGAHAPD